MRQLLTSLVAVALLASGGLAHTISGVTPSSGAIGTPVTITGTGFGTKKPAVFLTSVATGSKKFALKVTSSDDTTIVATVSKGVVGSFDVNVKIGPMTVTSAGALALLAPTITPGQAATADVGTSVVLDGTHFGTKTGKVFTAGKKATVVSWTDTAISFDVPVTVSNGPVVVVVTNALGDDAISDCLTVTGSSVPLGKDKVTGKLGGKAFKPHLHFVFVTSNNWTLTMTELGSHARTLTFHIFDLTTLPGIFDGTETTPATLSLSIKKVDGSFDALPGDFTITITHTDSSKLAGAISGVITGPGGKPVKIQDIEFLWTTGL